MKKITSLFALGAMLLLGSTKVNAAIGDAIPRTGWSVSVSSSCDDGSGGHAQHLFDDNHGTYWHSNWGGGNATGGMSGNNLSEIPEYFIVDLGAVQSIGGFGYQGRNNNGVVNQNNMNGGLKEYKIFVSSEPFSTIVAPATNDEKKAVLALGNPVVTGTLEWVGTEQHIATSSEVSGRYILVQYVSSYGPQNGFANCDEFYVYGWSDDLKPALTEKALAFRSKVEGVTVGTEYGNYAQETYDAAVAALKAAESVILDEASTDNEEKAALEALEEAIAAFVPVNPEGIFKLVSGCSAFYAQQGVYKALYATSAGVYAWGTVDTNSKPFYWNITTDAKGNISVQNAAYGTYISGMGTLSETAGSVTYQSLGQGQFALQCGGTIHANNHGGGAGVGSNIVSWTTGADGASAWIFEKVDEIPAAAEEAWVWINSDMENPIFVGSRASVLESGKQYFIYNTAMNSGEDRTGFLYSNGSGFGHDKARPSSIKLTRNNQWGYVWTVVVSENEGFYNIKASNGQYIDNKGKHVDTPFDFAISEWTASEVMRAGVASLSEDEVSVIANVDITPAHKVWTVSCAAEGNDKCWNGNANSFDTWESAHPYAFYEVVEAQALEAGDYIIQNVETGAYLSGGRDWGTHATLLNQPQIFTIEKLADGTYTLDSHQYSSATAHFLGDGEYLDAKAFPYSIEPGNAIGSYTINRGDIYLAAPTKVGEAIVFTNTSATATAAQWRFVTLADALAPMESATVRNPADATLLIKNYEMKRNLGYTEFEPNWVVTSADGTEDAKHFSWGWDANIANCAESWHSSNGFMVTQTVSEGVKPGVYSLTAHAFYAEAEGNLTLSVNEEEISIAKKTGDEVSMAAAYESFMKGLYKTEPIYVQVEEGGSLTITFRNASTDMWNIFGQLNLQYYGETTVAAVLRDEYIKQYNAAYKAVQDAIENNDMFEEDKAALENVLEKYTLDPEVDTELLPEAIQALKAAAAAAAEIYATKKYNTVRSAELLAAGEYNFTEFLVNPCFEENGTEGWTSEDKIMRIQGNDVFTLKTGSSYVEAWVATPATLADDKLYQQVVGLPAGKYVLAAEMQSTGDNGFYLQLGTERTVVGSAASYTVEFEYDGKNFLEVAAVLEGCTGNWVSVDNFRLFYVPELEDFTVEVSGIGEENIKLTLNQKTGAWEATEDVEPGTYTVQTVVDGKEVGEPVEVVVDVTRALYFKVDGYDPWLDVANLTVTLGDVATAINGVEAENGEQKVYTVSGQRAAKNYKGVVIVNGKLYIRK